MVQPRNIVVVGGGITGLSAAYTLQKLAEQQDTPTSIALFERDRHLGGKIQTERRDGFVIEGGPDTFVATKPWAVELCRDLGIADRLHGTNPERNRTFILHHDRLHRLPGGLTMMIPTEIKPMLATGLLSWPGKVRMGMDFLIPPRRNGVDETMGQFVSRRIGREAYERLIEPLMLLFLASVVLVLVIALMLPVIKMATTV